MPLQIQFFRVGDRYLRVVTADSQADQNSATNIPPGSTIFRTDNKTAWRWTGSAWASAEGTGGTPGENYGDVLLAGVYNPATTGGILIASQYVP